MVSVQHKSGRILPLLILGALVIAAVSGVMTLGGGTRASAQILSCDANFSIVKSAPGAGDTQFLFDVEYEPLSENTDPTFTESIGDGECIGITPRSTVTVREVPSPGWRLVDVECRTDSTVRRIPNGIILEAPTGQFEQYVSGLCIFYNAPVQQERPLNLGGLFAGQPTPLPTAPPPAAVAPSTPSQVISPPRTGDAGLK